MKEIVILTDKSNPEIHIVAPKNCVKEVVGNCWQVTASQPITYAKSLWDMKEWVVDD